MEDIFYSNKDYDLLIKEATNLPEMEIKNFLDYSYQKAYSPFNSTHFPFPKIPNLYH
jgi:hypothetical protein